MQIEQLVNLDNVKAAPFNFAVTYSPQGECLRHLFSGDLIAITSSEAECYQEIIEITRDRFTDSIYGDVVPIPTFGTTDPDLCLEEIDLAPENFIVEFTIMGWSLRSQDRTRPLHPAEVEEIMEIFGK
jgi:hypothetical protein